MVYRASFNSSVVLGFGWGLFYSSSMAPYSNSNIVIVQRRVSTGVSTNSREFAGSKFCMTLETLRNWREGGSSLK